MKIAAIFDLDETIYPGYSLKDLAKFLFKKGKIKQFFLLKVFYWMLLKKLDLLNDEKALEESLTLLKGEPISELTGLVNECFQGQMKNKIPNKIIEVINEHKKSGHYLILATETIDQVAQIFAEFLGFDYIITTKPEIIDNKLTGKLAGPVCMKTQKAQMIQTFCQKNNIDLENSYAYGGRTDDVDLLNLSKNATVINPNPSAQRLAQQKNWKILDTNVK